MTQEETMKKDTPRFIVPPNTLKAKVGEGGIPAVLLIKAQEQIDQSPEEFIPYARKYLEEIEGVLNRPLPNDNMVEELTDPVMQLKANGMMFQYGLISLVADTVLKLLERVKTVDADVIDIIHAHNKILSLIIQRDVKGTGGKVGKELIKELEEACTRYYQKRGISVS